MQATIYISPKAMETVNAIKELDYYDRVSLSDDEATDVTTMEGYHLIAKKLRLAVLPAGARCIVSVGPATQPPGGVSLPSSLRGCIFEKAPLLPADYAAIVTYWSGTPVCTDLVGAAHYQCPQNEYMVELPDGGGVESTDSFTIIDRLLSEGVVASIAGLGALTAHLVW